VIKQIWKEKSEFFLSNIFQRVWRKSWLRCLY